MAEDPKRESYEWCARAERVSPLVDGVEYFQFVRRALIAAQRQIWIVGWELHSEIDLVRGDVGKKLEAKERWPVRLSDLLYQLVDERPELEVRLLIWEGASVFALERQHLPRMKRPWDAHPRIKLVWDKDTPQLASHHQKLVVVDDAVAFSGGMDLTKSRWDSHAHHSKDARRQIPGILPIESKPYHDIMLAFDGEAAGLIGDWVRERWHRATQERIEPPQELPEQHDAWPKFLVPAFYGQDVCIALTQPDFGGRPEKRQVEASYLDQIASAKRLIFIETQYFSVRSIAEALANTLRRDDGPEVVIILPWGCPGALQSASMDPVRDVLLDLLRESDAHGRLGIYWATLHGGDPEDVHKNAVYIHAKTMVADDTLLRVGSANLANRSMGLDTELDVYFTASSEDGQKSVAAYRHRLTAYLLQVTPGDISEAEQETGSVLGAIERLREGQKTLHPFDHRAGSFENSMPFPIELADPDHPLSESDIEAVYEAIESYTHIGERARSWLSWCTGFARSHKWQLGAFAAIVAFIFLILTTPLGDQFDRASISDTFERIENSPGGLFAVFVTFAVLATVGVPLTPLVVAAGILLEFHWAFPISFLGAAISATVHFMLGRIAPKRMRAVFETERMERLMIRVRKRGVLAVVILRKIPVGPYFVMNTLCGVTGIRYSHFISGTLLSIAPTMLMITFFGGEIGSFLENPTWSGAFVATGVGLTVIVLALILDRLLRKLDDVDALEEAN